MVITKIENKSKSQDKWQGIISLLEKKMSLISGIFVQIPDTLGMGSCGICDEMYDESFFDVCCQKCPLYPIHCYNTGSTVIADTTTFWRFRKAIGKHQWKDALALARTLKLAIDNIPT